MKLSEKGFLKLFCKKGECLADIKEREFEPDDFKDCIVLTVEEAKEIAFKLKDLSEGYFLETGNIDSRSIEWSIVLDERIEQAEGKCSSEL